ncbi:hypothetical protein F5141DRAFT_1010836, partial [Pisolithus sp. B1]
HTMLQNHIECHFGVIKRHFHSLILPPEYSMAVQAQLPTTACCIHNIICLHNPDDIDIPDPNDDKLNEDNGPFLAPEEGNIGSLQGAPLNTESCRQMNAVHVTIAAEMWDDYCAEHVRHNMPHIIKQLD